MGLLTSFVENLFFHADSQQYWKPGHYGLRHVAFKAKIKEGHEIDGIVIPAQSQDGVVHKETVIHCNAACFNREFCLPQVAFLAQTGFTVVLFDYSGCGVSTGKTTLSGLLQDTEAVVDWLDGSEFQKDKYVFFGQGVGGDAALQFSHAHPKKVSGLVLESVYHSRKGWAKDRWGPIIGDIAAASIACTSVEPGVALSDVHVPAVLIWPSKDTFVRSSERRKMLDSAPKHVQVWEAKGLKYQGVFGAQRNVWHDDLIKFLAQKVGGEHKK